MFTAAVYYWLTGALLSIVLELGNPGLFLFLSFSCGAFSGAGAAWFEAAFYTQIFIALLVSFISFLVMGWWIQQRSTTVQRHKTNIDLLIGKHGIVLDALTAGTVGTVKVAGEVWSARTHSAYTIEKGEGIVVIEVRGAHLVVNRIPMKG